MNQMDFRSRCAVVTGGAAGIGLAVAKRIAASGALDVHLPAGGTDETGRLARAFETMLDDLLQYWRAQS